jgi:peptidoglycan/LPS O-acetylase OafA/YrhL
MSKRGSHAYFPAFDVFRGIGIVFVVLAHAPTKGDLFGPLRPLGALGVHMFFALSGFLITYRFLEERHQTGHIDLPSFYRRRVRRIVPPALIYLSLLAVVGAWLHWLPVKWDEIAAALFFYRNLFQAQAPYGWYTGHFWSLSLEEQFYMAWPILLVAMKARARTAALILIAVTVVWRIHVLRVNPSADIYRPDLLADHLLWGCVIGLSWPAVLSIPARVREVAGVVGIGSATALIYLQPPFWQPVFAFCVAVGFILAADAWQVRWKAFQKMGEASYDCYIWQSLFLPLPFAAMLLPLWQRAPISYLLIVAATAGSFRLTFPKRRRTAAEATGARI